MPRSNRCLLASSPLTESFCTMMDVFFTFAMQLATENSNHFSWRHEPHLNISNALALLFSPSPTQAVDFVHENN